MEKNTLESALKEFSQGTTDNIDSIMIKDAAGKQYWMKKADLASVLGELLNIDGIKNDFNGDFSDFSQWTNPGVYRYNRWH